MNINWEAKSLASQCIDAFSLHKTFFQEPARNTIPAMLFCPAPCSTRKLCYGVPMLS